MSTRLDGDMAEIRIAEHGHGGFQRRAGPKSSISSTRRKRWARELVRSLALAHSVITQKHSGSITFESEVGKGTECSSSDCPVNEKVPSGGDNS